MNQKLSSTIFENSQNIFWQKSFSKIYTMDSNFSGSGGGPVVYELAFNSVNLCSDPAKVYNFCVKIVDETNENKQNDAGVGPSN